MPMNLQGNTEACFIDVFLKETKKQKQTISQLNSTKKKGIPIRNVDECQGMTFLVRNVKCQGI